MIVTAGGNINLGATTIGGDQIKGSKYVMSGDFRGAVLNIESQLAHVTQTILAAPVGDASGRADLSGLIAALESEIVQLPAGRMGEGEALAARLTKVARALADGDGELAVVGGMALERAAKGLLARVLHTNCPHYWRYGLPGERNLPTRRLDAFTSKSREGQAFCASTSIPSSTRR